MNANEVSFHHELSDCPLSLRSLKAKHNGQWVLLEFPQSGARLLAVAEQVSNIGRCRFLGKPFLKKEGSPWLAMEALALCSFLLNHLSLTLAGEFNEELLEQVQNSRDITRAFLGCNEANRDTTNNSFIRAEQSLLWGHALHPSPKSRHGVPLKALLQCSPEISASFPLFWFEISPGLIRLLGEQAEKVEKLFGHLHGDSSHLYPCHPWEADYLLKQPLILAAIEQGLLKPRGTLGKPVQPTSSVRTVYREDLDLQMKFSIHVRLTNCIRKNAWYELQSAVCLTGLLRPLASEAREHCPDFQVMYEPLASTLDLGALAGKLGMNASTAQTCTESFGILFRENLSAHTNETLRPQLAAGLFACDARGRSIIATQVADHCRRLSISYPEMALNWFQRYVDISLRGIFYYFFKQGVVFEPHLQNTVVGFHNGLPHRIWIRDLEGTKLLPEFWPTARLSELQPRARQSVYYEREKGWKRIAYCLLVNNFSEAIFHLAAGHHEDGNQENMRLESELWLILRTAVERWQAEHGSQPELEKLLLGEKMPSKNNFTTRLLKQADFQAGYTNVKNPLVLSSTGQAFH
ncbi:IucA/IucC family protein [Microbulbifer mangrovi]|uniref:IucA/IucC family protein n=1 Tax=Microbulbifer mangrovi TaxID=927787 RepID=UPI001300F984|nr:IucA/IucC family protein [Microbulbifer mangrovi]